MLGDIVHNENVIKDLNQAGSNPKVSRALIKFDLSEISQSIHTGIISTNAKFYLNDVEFSLYKNKCRIYHLA